MVRAQRRVRALVVMALCGCYPHDTPRGCNPYGSPPPAVSREVIPDRLSELGLYSDLRSGTVVPEARPYRPTFALWSDGASKRRWIRLPAGATIDTSNIDSWRFPIGTELYKEFSVEGKRIETRILRRVSADDNGWAAMTYAWNAAQTEARAATDGVTGALGTKYDIPSTRTCMACHGGRPEHVLGFGAIQLSHEATQAEELTLDRLAGEGWMSVPPTHPIAVPGTPEDVAAIGYLHANCGHCHNDGRPRDASYYRPPPSVDFGLRVQDLGSLGSTRAQITANRFRMGDNPARNHIILRCMTREGTQWRRMPPVATKVLDTEGLALVHAWLERSAKN